MAKLIVKTRKDRLREAWAALRAERDHRLAETDWVVARAYERGAPVPEAWAAYRQALRDLPQTLTDEEVLAWHEGRGSVPWPEVPS
ncbi:MAG: phage tail assembly chaperone [Thermus sp.]|uniref:phage tail assembly chaperone n=1 Tax=Thermus sp. TaxID=275 RepID=UPI003918788E